MSQQGQAKPSLLGDHCVLWSSGFRPGLSLTLSYQLVEQNENVCIPGIWGTMVKGVGILGRRKAIKKETRKQWAARIMQTGQCLRRVLAVSVCSGVKDKIGPDTSMRCKAAIASAYSILGDQGRRLHFTQSCIVFEGLGGISVRRSNYDSERAFMLGMVVHAGNQHWEAEEGWTVPGKSGLYNKSLPQNKQTSSGF